MAGYERKIVRLLKENGFTVIRNPRDSHVIWGKDSLHIPVPSKIKKRHTANGILKKAGINFKFS